MKRSLNLTAILTAVLLLACPALAEKPTKQADKKTPAQAIGEDTMLAVYLDVQQFSPEMIAGLGMALQSLAENEAIQKENLAIPLGDPKQMADTVAAFRGSFVEAGGEGLMLTLQMPDPKGWSPPVSLLAKTNDKFNAQSMADVVRTIAFEDMKASVDSIGGAWKNISVKSQEGEAVTLPLPQPDALAYAAFDKQLSQHNKPMLAIAFRMQDEIREKMDNAEALAKQAQPGQDAQAQMAMGMMMGMFKPVREMDTFGLAVSQVDGGMLVDLQMAFRDAQSAQQFANLYNGMLMFAPMMLASAGQQGDIPNMPDPQTINNVFMKLKMQLNGDTLNLTLDQAFFDLMQQLAPMFEGLQGQATEAEEL